jgi:WD40 repeat protein
VRSVEELAVLRCDSNAYGLAFAPDGTCLAVGCADNTIFIWDVSPGRQVVELRGHAAYVHAAYVHALAFSPDGTQLVSASGDWTVRIWDALKPAERSPGSFNPPLIRIFGTTPACCLCRDNENKSELCDV